MVDGNDEMPRSTGARAVTIPTTSLLSDHHRADRATVSTITVVLGVFAVLTLIGGLAVSIGLPYADYHNGTISSMGEAIVLGVASGLGTIFVSAMLGFFATALSLLREIADSQG
jgi:hypothetical protein